MKSIVTTIWAANLALPLLLIYVAATRGHWKQRPIFFGCVCLFAIRTISLMLLVNSPAYAGVYYGSTFIVNLAILAVAVEIGCEVFPRFKTHATNIAIVAMLVFGASFYLSALQATGGFRQTMESAAIYLAGSGFMAVWVYAHWFKVQAKPQAYSIAAGFLFMLTTQAVIGTISFKLGVLDSRVAGMLAFTAAQCVWIYHHWRPAVHGSLVGVEGLKKAVGRVETCEQQLRRLA